MRPTLYRAPSCIVDSCGTPCTPYKSGRRRCERIASCATPQDIWLWCLGASSTRQRVHWSIDEPNVWCVCVVYFFFSERASHTYWVAIVCVKNMLSLLYRSSHSLRKRCAIRKPSRKRRWSMRFRVVVVFFFCVAFLPNLLFVCGEYRWHGYIVWNSMCVCFVCARIGFSQLSGPLSAAHRHRDKIDEGETEWCCVAEMCSFIWLWIDRDSKGDVLYHSYK